MMLEQLKKQFELNGPPAAFNYGGKAYLGFKEGFEQLDEQIQKGKKSVASIKTYRHSASGTLWTVKLTHYPIYGALEWQAEIFAPEKTEIFSELCYQLDVPGQNGMLMGNYGDEGRGYEEYSARLSEKSVRHEALDGRPTHYVFPYYRLETDAGKLFAVLSWQGGWFAQFEQKDAFVRLTAGQMNVSAYLEKGERFRLPLMVVLEYAQEPANAWRRFYIDCNMPLVKNEPLKPLLGAFNGVCAGLSDGLVRRVKKAYDSNNIDYDFWWFDAGWGTDGTGPHNKEGWWYHGVNFEMNREIFPDGLKSFGEELAQSGKDFMLWFEPEMVRTPIKHMEEFFQAHPDFKREWLIGTFQKEWCGITLTSQLINLGDEQCLKWIEAHIFEVMDTAGANIFRIDFNSPPREIWGRHDRLGRQGITENHYCTGYLQLLKDIQARYPGILMDSCASGGGRNDLETMRLMIPLHYSDHQDICPQDSNGFIYMQQVLYRWFPYIKNFIAPYTLSDQYAMRAAYNPCMVCSCPPEELDAFNFDKLREYIKEWREINKAYMGNYYELEKASRDDSQLKAFMFFNEKENIGFILVFCPENCTRTEYRAVLQGLKEGSYMLENMNTHKRWSEQGEALCTQGLELTLKPRTAHLIKISRES